MRSFSVFVWQQQAGSSSPRIKSSGKVFAGSGISAPWAGGSCSISAVGGFAPDNSDDRSPYTQNRLFRGERLIAENGGIISKRCGNLRDRI